MNQQLTDIEQHNREIRENLDFWNKKPLLQKIYKGFYNLIAGYIPHIDGKIVDLGSGIGHIKEVIPECITTDIFPNEWIDQVEDAYRLSFADDELKSVILFDVFHHLQYPGTALKEFHRALAPGGRVIMLEPAMSLLGLFVYGCMHHEPLGLKDDMTLYAPDDFDPAEAPYYAAQGNATRIFCGGEQVDQLQGWKTVAVKRMAKLSYIGSGGYRGPQLYPTCLYPFMKLVDGICSLIPPVFGTRLLVVLEKK